MVLTRADSFGDCASHDGIDAIKTFSLIRGDAGYMATKAISSSVAQCKYKCLYYYGLSIQSLTSCLMISSVKAAFETHVWQKGPAVAPVKEVSAVVGQLDAEWNMDST